MALRLVSSTPMDIGIYNSLNETRSLLYEVERDNRKVASDFKIWMSQRNKSIDALNGLQKKLENIEYSCRVMQGSGAALAIAGNVAEVVLYLCGYKDSAKLLTSSKVCAVAGSVTAVSSSLAEMGLTYSVINEVKETLRKDQKLTIPLLKTLNYSRTIDHYLVQIFNCSILSKLFYDTLQFCYSCLQLMEQGEVEFSKLMKKLESRELKDMNISDYTEAVIENVYTTLKNIYTNEEMRGLFRDICYTIQQNPLILKLLKVELKLCFQICGSAIIGIFSNNSELSALTYVSSHAKNSFLHAIEIAFQVVTLVTSVQNIKKQSTNSKMLSDLIIALRMELNAVCKIYSVQFERT